MALRPAARPAGRAAGDAQVVAPTPPASKEAAPSKLATPPTRCYLESSVLQRFVGFLAASIFSVVYIAAPLIIIGTLVCLAARPAWLAGRIGLGVLLVAAALPSSLSAKLGPHILRLWPMQQIPKYFRYEEFHELTDSEIAEQQAAGKRFIFSIHPHGVITFVGICAAVSAAGARDGLFKLGVRDLPTAAASVIKLVPLLKNVLCIFGVENAAGSVLAKRLKRKGGSVVIYVGGMAELFRSSPEREVVFLKARKGFIKLALSTGADVIPVYMFGNTTVLSVLNWGPLANLSRSVGVSLTLFWGRLGLPVPKAVKLTYARGRPLGLPHIPEPSQEDIDKWHAEYCERLTELFDKYKGSNPDYSQKTLVIE